MKTLFRLGLAVFVATFLTVRGWARYGIPEGVNSSDHAKKSHHWKPHFRSNKGGKASEDERAQTPQETKAGNRKNTTSKK
jgi:hypothetical protein